MKNHPRLRSQAAFLLGLAAAAALSSCTMRDLRATPPGPGDVASTTRALRNKVDTIVVIYAENRAFDNLYGNFPGARNLDEVVDHDGRPLPGYVPQQDRDGTILP